jgi:hypothetical protein
MGGIQAVLEFIVLHEDQEVRIGANRLFTSVTSNNQKVQEFVTRLGGVNLSYILEK